MNVNIPFTDNYSISGTWNFFEKEKETPQGIWPLQKNGVWHTGIHLKNSKNDLIRAIIPGEVVAYRIADKYSDNPLYEKDKTNTSDYCYENPKYSTTTVLMKHYFGEKAIPFYMLYTNLADAETINKEEFNYYKNEGSGTPYKLYQPLFFKKWIINPGAIKKENKQVIPYYSDKEFKSEKGYLFRDGCYLVCETYNGNTLYRDDTEFYLKKNISGFTKQQCPNKDKTNLYTNSEFILATQTHTDSSTYSKVINVYYNNTGNKKKKFYFKLNEIKSSKHTNVSSNNLKQIVTINFNHTSDYHFNYEKNLVIITNAKLKKKEYKFSDSEISEKLKASFSRTEYIQKAQNIKNTDKKIEYTSAELYNNYLFAGDEFKLESTNATELTISSKTYYLYFITKTKASTSGYIDWNEDVNKIISTRAVYSLETKKITNCSSKQLVTLHDSFIKQDTGITLYNYSQVLNSEVMRIIKTNKQTFALLKIKCGNDTLNNYTKLCLCGSANDRYFYAYLEVENNLNFTDIVTSTYRNSAFNKVVINQDSSENDEYFGPIGIYDGNNNLDLHIETFFTSLDDFSFIKKKNDEIQMVELSEKSKSLLYKPDRKDEILLKDTKFWIQNNAIYVIKYYCDLKTQYEKLKYILYKKIPIDLNPDKYNYTIESNTQIVIFNDNYKDLNIKKGKIYYLDGKYENCILDKYKQKNSDYYIYSFSKLSTASILNPFELPENTILYKSKNQKIVQVNKNEKIPRPSQFLAISNSDFVKINSKNYLLFSLNDKSYYLPEDALDSFECNSEYEQTLEEEKDGSKKIENNEETKRYNISDLPNFVLLEENPSTESDYRCDLKSLLFKIGLISTDDKKHNNVSCIYKDSTLYNDLTRLIIKAPSMWEKPSDWDSNYKKYITDDYSLWGVTENELPNVKKYIENQFFVTPDNKKKLIDSTSTKHYYFHPIKFLEYYLKKTVQDFNPYVNKVLVDLPGQSSGGVTLVTHNPGFSPLHDGTSFKTYVPTEKNELSFSDTTGIFNDDYIGVTSYYNSRFYFFHEGLDLQGSKGTDIYSLVYCKVLSFGTINNYGNVIIVKRLSRKNDIYLIAHLSEFSSKIKLGSIIAPGDIVGKVGGTGTGGKSVYSPHLHISYWN
ncbi:MAG: M23 family metallopeptidase, partial [Bacteroidales bacterium]|nr:M23 family metallopeptidase [Bacteroidales bacterium]